MRILLAHASALPDLYWVISQGERIQYPDCATSRDERYRSAVDHLAVLVALAARLAAISRQQALLDSLESEVAKAFMGG